MGMAREESDIMLHLDYIGAERIVRELWPHYHPGQIAGIIHNKNCHLGITARWVESIKRRIDKRTLFT